MSGSTICLLVALIACSHSVSGAGELVVLRSPGSFEFDGRDALRESQLKEVYSAALGFSVDHGPGWSGLVLTDPFGSAEAAVEIYVDGVATLGSEGRVRGHRYPVLTDRDGGVGTWESLRRRISSRFPEGDNLLVQVDLSSIDEQTDLFGDLPVGPRAAVDSLRPEINDEDRRFLDELERLDAITKKVESGAIVPDDKPDFFRFVVRSLHPLSDLHGSDSPATLEAEALLGAAAAKLAEAFRKAYDGNALVTLVTGDSSHTRRARSLLEESSASKIHLLNIAKTYTVNYPVIFNIIFWFVVVLILTLIAVSYTIADMDPGRDSIIYRMTSNRMKKDN